MKDTFCKLDMYACKPTLLLYVLKTDSLPLLLLNIWCDAFDRGIRGGGESDWMLTSNHVNITLLVEVSDSDILSFLSFYFSSLIRKCCVQTTWTKPFCSQGQ